MFHRRHAAMMLIVGAAAISMASCSEDSGSTAPTEVTMPTPSATDPSPTQTAQDPTNIEAVGARSIRVGGDWLSAGAGSIWLSGQDAIYRLDPHTGRTVATIEVPDVPCEASDFGLGHLWSAVCGEEGLVKIDPRTDRVVGRASLQLPDISGEGSIGVGAGAVWLVLDGSDCAGCVVARVDPVQLKVTARVPVESGAAAVRFGEGYVWATNPERNTVVQVDPQALKVVKTHDVGTSPRFFAVYGGSVWTLDQGSGTVSRVVIESGETTEIPADMQGEGGDLAAGGGWIWARGSGTLLKRIDPRTNAVVETYGPDSGSGAAIVGYGSVWLSAHDISTVWALPLPAI